MSLVPQATEIVAALGLADRLVGVTHRCDYPPEVSELPKVVRTDVDESWDSATIDRFVRERSRSGDRSLFVDAEVIADLSPDVVLAQHLCEVCAVSARDVVDLAAVLPPRSRIVWLGASTISELFEDIRATAAALDVPDRGERLIAGMQERLERLRSITARVPKRPRVVCLEWLDPPYVAGHWIPELVDAAGGVELLGRAGDPSREIDWAQLAAARPDVIVLALCGFGADEAARRFESEALAVFQSLWKCVGGNEAGDPPGGTRPADVAAARATTSVVPKVVAVDGDSYFSRAGPRILRGAEILASVFHEEAAEDISKTVAAPAESEALVVWP